MADRRYSNVRRLKVEMELDAVYGKSKYPGQAHAWPTALLWALLRDGYGYKRPSEIVAEIKRRKARIEHLHKAIPELEKTLHNLKRELLHQLMDIDNAIPKV